MPKSLKKNALHIVDLIYSKVFVYVMKIVGVIQVNYIEKVKMKNKLSKT